MSLQLPVSRVSKKGEKFDITPGADVGSGVGLNEKERKEETMPTLPESYWIKEDAHSGDKVESNGFSCLKRIVAIAKAIALPTSPQNPYERRCFGGAGIACLILLKPGSFSTPLNLPYLSVKVSPTGGIEGGRVGWGRYSSMEEVSSVEKF